MGRFLLFTLLFPAILQAHPGWGLQVDASGTVYFTDLEHVYAASPSGEIRRLVPDVHAHALYLDEDQQLLGDHSWVDQHGVFHQSWWRLGSDGRRLEISAHEAAAHFGMPAPGGGMLVLDSNLHENRAELLRLSKAGHREVIGGGAIGSVDGSLVDARFGAYGASIPDGHGGMLVTCGSQLRAIDRQGRVTTLVGAENGYALDADRSSSLLGLAHTSDGDVVVADLRGRRVIRHDRRSGKVIEVLRAAPTWHLAGVFATSEYLFVLEYSRLPLSGAVRVRRADAAGQVDTIADNR